MLVDSQQRTVARVLGILVIFDLWLVSSTLLAPDLWFTTFHETATRDEMGWLFLRRCTANWTAFFALQLMAWRWWRKQPGWLAVIAGVRGSDVLTDPIYTVLSGDPTWFALASLPAMGLINLGLALFLWRAYRSATANAVAGSAAAGSA